MDKNIFAKRLSNLLEEKGLTQREAGEMMGVSHVCISRYVKGDREPKISNVASLSKGLGVSVDYLLGLTEQRQIEGTHIEIERVLDDITAVINRHRNGVKK